MKILCVIDSLGSGGAQRQLVNIANGFKEKGHDVSFLLYHKKNFFKEDTVNINIHYIIEDNYFKRLLKMRNYIKKGGFDSILSFLEAANFITTFSSVFNKKWKLIIGERSSNPNILKSFRLRFYRLLFFCADYIVSNSNENIKIVKKVNPFLPTEKFKVIYNTVDSNLWKPSKKYLTKKDEKLNIVVAASHQHNKNAKGLIEALTELPEEVKSQLVINWYGEASSDNSYNINQKLIEKFNLSSVLIFHKATNDILSKMQHADAIGLFSFYEGLPNTICEGLTIGKPIIASSVSDLPIILKGTQNILFDPISKDEIKDSIISLLSMSEKKLISLGEKNRILGIKIFNKEEVISNYLKLIG